MENFESIYLKQLKVVAECQRSCQTVGGRDSYKNMKDASDVLLTLTTILTQFRTCQLTVKSDCN